MHHSSRIGTSAPRRSASHTMNSGRMAIPTPASSAGSIASPLFTRSRPVVAIDTSSPVVRLRNGSRFGVRE